MEAVDEADAVCLDRLRRSWRRSHCMFL